MPVKTHSRPAPIQLVGLKPMGNNAKKGTKVIFGPAPGVRDKDPARKFLKPGKAYTVERTMVDPWTAQVVLAEFPEQRFDAVMFWEAPAEGKAKT